MATSRILLTYESVADGDEVQSLLVVDGEERPLYAKAIAESVSDVVKTTVESVRGTLEELSDIERRRSCRGLFPSDAYRDCMADIGKRLTHRLVPDEIACELAESIARSRQRRQCVHVTLVGQAVQDIPLELLWLPSVDGEEAGFLGERAVVSRPLQHGLGNASALDRARRATDVTRRLLARAAVVHEQFSRVGVNVGCSKTCVPFRMTEIQAVLDKVGSRAMVQLVGHGYAVESNGQGVVESGVVFAGDGGRLLASPRSLLIGTHTLDSIPEFSVVWIVACDEALGHFPSKLAAETGSIVIAPWVRVPKMLGGRLARACWRAMDACADVEEPVEFAELWGIVQREMRGLGTLYRVYGNCRVNLIHDGDSHES